MELNAAKISFRETGGKMGDKLAFTIRPQRRPLASPSMFTSNWKKLKEYFVMATNATTAEERLAKLGIHLPDAPTPFGAYVPAVQTVSLLFLRGMLATAGHEVTEVGVVGNELDVKSGQEAAYRAALNALALTKKQLGSLDRVSRIVRLGVYIAATPDFTEHPKVADAASELFRDVFGDETMSSRLVIGVASLPLGSPVELEVILEVKA